jgi:ubiquitin-conjugating enzyme E2 J1
MERKSVKSNTNPYTTANKRIMNEYKSMQKEPLPFLDAHPLEGTLFEWHFTLRGPKDSPYEGGWYHGRMTLPTDYPLKPPDIIFYTPSGRFQTNTKICLSVTGFHQETWQPSWGIRTVLIALRSFLITPAKGAVGSLDYTPQEKKRLAEKSGSWLCKECQKTNRELLPDRPESVRGEGDEGR